MPFSAHAASTPDPKAVEVFVGGSEMALLMRATDWSATPLGPVESWSQSLRATIRLMLTSRFPMWLGWGEELMFFYNDAYAARTLGEKHPWALGKPFAVVWSEVWREVIERVESVLRTGVASWDEKLLLFLERNGYPEETYHTFSYSPVHDDDGVIRGNLCVVTEETERVIGERRLGLLKRLAEQLSGATTTADVCSALGRTLAADARDLPFTLTYLSDPQTRELALVSYTGLPADHPVLRAGAGESAELWPLARVMEEGDAALQVELPRGQAWPSGPWPRPPSSALVTPIAQQGQRPAGVFVSALSPHVPIDEAYRGFVSLLVGQLAAGLANARVHEASAAEPRRWPSSTAPRPCSSPT